MNPVVGGAMMLPMVKEFTDYAAQKAAEISLPPDEKETGRS